MGCSAQVKWFLAVTDSGWLMNDRNVACGAEQLQLATKAFAIVFRHSISGEECAMFATCHSYWYRAAGL